MNINPIKTKKKSQLQAFYRSNGRTLLIELIDNTLKIAYVLLTHSSCSLF